MLLTSWALFGQIPFFSHTVRLFAQCSHVNLCSVFLQINRRQGNLFPSFYTHTFFFFIRSPVFCNLWKFSAQYQECFAACIIMLQSFVTAAAKVEGVLRLFFALFVCLVKTAQSWHRKFILRPYRILYFLWHCCCTNTVKTLEAIQKCVSLISACDRVCQNRLWPVFL